LTSLVRLMMYSFILWPGFALMAVFYFLSTRVRRDIWYGRQVCVDVVYSCLTADRPQSVRSLSMSTSMTVRARSLPPCAGGSSIHTVSCRSACRGAIFWTSTYRIAISSQRAEYPSLSLSLAVHGSLATRRGVLCLRGVSASAASWLPA
jgi:hypothetical protein